MQTFNINPETITDAQWEKIIRDSGAKSKKALFADMTLGKQLPAVIAKRLESSEDTTSSKNGNHEPITILGTEGITVQFAKCCRPIPGDIIVGFINKDQGLVIHAHDCSLVTKNHKHPDNWLDVTWGKDIDRPFPVNIKIIAANKSGVLARITTEIAKAGSNIDDVKMESEEDYTAMKFVLQAYNRQHLAKMMRALRHVEDVAKITRVKG